MAAAQRGDRRAYEQLLRELGSAIELYVRRRFASLMFVEDCVQECLLAIHKGRHTYNPQRPFRPWLFAIVRNRVIDLLRGNYEGNGAPGADAAHIYAHPDPGDELAAGDVLDRLAPQQRRALTLTKIYGYSVAEAAAQSGISESAMKSRVSRALRAASQLLERESEGG